MTKEMYVSTTPHETKVAVVEDDQLAEIFFERENEYTLAGSIYKGRVTRVLPGMQSAFVDIGLERDAFLYVSDFLELGDEQEDFEELIVSPKPEIYVTNRPQPQPKTFDFQKPTEAGPTAVFEGPDEPELMEEEPEASSEIGPVAADQGSEEAGQLDRGLRSGRRRRRGRRGRGFPESKFDRSVAPEEVVEEAQERFASPAGTEPIVLPGESISKYQRMEDRQAEAQVVSHAEEGADRGEHIPEHPVTLPEPKRREPQAGAQGSEFVVLPGETITKYRRSEAVPVPTEGPANVEAHTEEVLDRVPAVPGIETQEPLPQQPTMARTYVPGPMVLPGESISKYRKQPESLKPEEPPIATAQPESEQERVDVAPVADSVPAVVENPPQEAAPKEVAPRREYAPTVLPGESIAKYQPKPHPAEISKPEAAAPVLAEPEGNVSSPVTAEAEDEGDQAKLSGPEHKEEEKTTELEPLSEARTERKNPIAPFILPGEFISKYRRMFEQRKQKSEPEPESDQKLVEEASHIVSKNEPLAVTLGREVEHEAEVHEDLTEEQDVSAEQHGKELNKRFDGRSASESRGHQSSNYPVFSPSARGTIEHEEIEEDEADLHPYREDLDDAQFEELEEETLEADSSRSKVEANGLTEAVVDSMVEEESMEGSYESEGNGAAEDGTLTEEVGPQEYDFDSEAEAAHEQAHVEAYGQPTGIVPSIGYQRPDKGYDPRRGRGRRPPRRGGMRPRREAPRQHAQIADLLKEGQEVLIQIAKEPIAKKGARITSHIALPGRFLVYMPTVNHVGVSRKINSEEERQRLKRIMISEREGGHGGFIVRTAAAGTSEEELRADIRFLKNLWAEIKSRAESSKAPAIIYHDLNLVERILRDQVTQEFSAVWVDSEQEYERILRFANRFQPSLLRKVKLYTKDTPLFEQFNIQEEINKSLKSKVWLKSGGYIVINQTEALVAIDINTGKYVGKTARLEDTIVKTNVDAIKEIVRQIRLRDLGGIIVIDFIDMDERRNRQKVMQALEEALKSDRAPSKVLQFNDFGLVAITRKRVKQSLERTLGIQCPYCTGTGMVKSVTTICNEIYVEMRKIAAQLDRNDVLLRVNPEVGKALKANGVRWIQEFEELTGKTVLVKNDPLLHQEQFDIQ